MKKFGFYVCAVAALAMTFASCEKKNNQDPTPSGDDNLPSGFYVAAVGATLTKANAMDQGTNEVDQTAREGMYEKYFVLDANTEYEFVNKFGEKKQAYGADLEYGDSLIVTDNQEIAGYKASLVSGKSFKVKDGGLYHIVLDFDKDGSLTDVGGAQVIIVPVEWGVRGGMNSWGWTKATSFHSEGGVYTWTWTDQELAAGGSFKFAHDGCWKINLDIANLVKANTNLGVDCLPGGENIAVEKAGLYEITLTYKAAESSAIKDSYSMSVTLTQESTLPTTMYGIGAGFGGWDWAADYIVDFVPVHSHPGQFWAIRKIEAEEGFKFCATKAWNGDFTGEAGEYTEVKDGNVFVKETGIYTIHIDVKAGNVVTIYPAEVYGMGNCFGGWDEGNNPFVLDAANGIVTGTTAAEGEVRIYAKMPDNAGNWWQSEFTVLNGKIAYRADGGDQERVNAAAGATITLDFNAGTGEIK